MCVRERETEREREKEGIDGIFLASQNLRRLASLQTRNSAFEINIRMRYRDLIGSKELSGLTSPP